mgnify:CR=1 FL=1
MGRFVAEAHWLRAVRATLMQPGQGSSDLVNVCFLRVALLPLLYLAISVAYAEGGCPAGMYPIGGQGVQGCAPIPGAQGAGASGTSSAPLPPRLLGEWIETWGALAGSIEGEEGGASVSELTEAAAREKSIANCERQGGGRCKVVFVYQNQCVSAVTSELASTGTKYVTAASEEIATKLAVQDCEKAGGKQCKSIYSACTVPFFKKY